MAIQRRSLGWIDAGGRTRQTIPAADPDNSAIMTALMNHSNAVVQTWFEGPVNNTLLTPVSAPFPDVIDTARLIFQGPSGEQAALILPAPKANIFLVDGVTVDPSTIVDIITASVGHLVVASGSPVTAYVAGVRSRTKGFG